MDRRFEVIILEDAMEFLDSLDGKAREKMLYIMDKAALFNDPKLFKKLKDEIWEFRLNFNKTQYRILAFWDKRDKNDTLVVASNGFIKKTQKIPTFEIEKAERIRQDYFDD